MLSNNLMSYCLNFFVYVKIIMMNLDTAIDTFLSPIADKISGIIFSSVTIHGVKIEFLVALLMFAAFYFTFRTRFIGVWGFKHALQLITKNYEHKDIRVKKKKGEVSSFQALTATISASAGIGNDWKYHSSML